MKQHAQLPLLTVMFLIGLSKHAVVVRGRVGREVCQVAHFRIEQQNAANCQNSLTKKAVCRIISVRIG